MAWRTQCNKIEFYIQKKAVRALFFKSPIAHTERIFKRMNQLKLTNMYTCILLKLYYKLCINKLPDYFDNFLHRHNLRNGLIRLPAIRCDFGEMNSTYHSHDQSNIFLKMHTILLLNF